MSQIPILIPKIARSTLKSYFLKGNMPTEENVNSFIDSSINKFDDTTTIELQEDESTFLGIGTDKPLCRVSIRADKGTERIIGLEDSEGQETWTILQSDAGLSLRRPDASTADLQIQSTTGNIGIGVNDPQGELEVNGALSSTNQSDESSFLLGHNGEAPGASLRFDPTDEHLRMMVGDHPENGLTIGANGTAGINTPPSDTTLMVNGSLKAAFGNSISRFSSTLTSQASNEEIATQKAIKTYLGNSRVHLGLPSMCSAARYQINTSSITNQISWQDMPDMNLTLHTTGGKVLIRFNAGSLLLTGVNRAEAEFQMLVNNVKVSGCMLRFDSSSGVQDVALNKLIGNLPAGTHQVQIQWSIKSEEGRDRKYVNTSHWHYSGHWHWGRWGWFWAIWWHNTSWYHETGYWLNEIRARLYSGWNGGYRKLTAFEL